ncbi:MAG: COX15/CtaA family protein [Planctomycetaceae bacterium]
MLPRQKWTHRLALAVVVVTLLLPVTIGSLTTTLGAGMAFLDWPTSDGQNMLFYDMLRDIRLGNTDKVAEHGHRLAGMIVGLLSIPLAILGWRDGRAGVRMLTLGIVAGVIGQGVLGGARVLLDARTLAMLHSLGAAVIVSLMGLTAVVTSRKWARAAEATIRPGAGLATLTVITTVAVAVQFVAGGFVRHFGLALTEHLVGAVVVGVVSLVTAMMTVQGDSRELRAFGWGVFAAVLIQVMLGFGAWAGKFGLAALGIVAVERGPFQVTLRTLHTTGGMVLLMAAVLLLVAVFQLRRSNAASVPIEDMTSASSTPLGRSSQGVAVAGGIR